MKYCCRFDDAPGILWKFAGLGSAYGADRDRLHEGKVKPFRRLGFEALDWQEGTPLQPGRAEDAIVLNQACQYLTSSAGPELPADEQSASVRRLRDILFWNLQKASGEDSAQRILKRMDRLKVHGAGPGYTDGRMALHEWVETPGGHLVKTDTRGNVFDHTLVGPQSLLWDVVGLLVEWDLNGDSRSMVLRHVKSSHLTLTLDELPFYEAAHVAFTMGLCQMAAFQTNDTLEQTRLNRAAARYLERLVR